MRRWRRLISVFCLLCLLGAQQAAYAHWISHIGGDIAAAVESDGPNDDGTGGGSDDGDDPPSHVCATCAAFAALNAAPPVIETIAAVAPATAAPIPEPSSTRAPAPSVPPYIARAPPAGL